MALLVNQGLHVPYTRESEDTIEQLKRLCKIRRTARIKSGDMTVVQPLWFEMTL